MERARLIRWFPFLAWPLPTRQLLTGELSAGLTIALMLLPQGVAYAALAGMPLVTGIYAALVPALVAVLWSGTPRLGVGPTALTSLLVGASLTGLATPGSAQWVALAGWLALLAGGVQWLLGALRGGWIFNLVTSPVLNGFTQAAGVLILLSQLPSLLGLRTTWHALRHQPSWHHFDPVAASFGVGALAALWCCKRWLPRIPAAIALIALSGVASWVLGFGDQDGAVVGHLPTGLPVFSLPDWVGWTQAQQLLLPVLIISLVSFLEVASSAQVEHRHAGTRWNENQDLVAHGMAKVAAGLSGSFPISASFSRSAVTLHSGARTGWATVFAIGLVLVCVVWLTPMLYHVPQAVLAAVVITAVLNLIRPRTLWALCKISRVEGVIAWITCAVTLATAPRLYWGVLTGMVLSLCYFLHHRLHPRIVELGQHPDGSLRSRHIWNLPRLAPNMLALRLDAEWDFASAQAFERCIEEALQQDPSLRMVYLDAQPINRIDVSGVESFQRLQKQLRTLDIPWHIAGLKLPVQRVLEHAGVLAGDANLQLHRTNAQALTYLRAHGVKFT